MNFICVHYDISVDKVIHYYIIRKLCTQELCITFWTATMQISLLWLFWTLNSVVRRLSTLSCKPLYKYTCNLFLDANARSLVNVWDTKISSYQSWTRKYTAYFSNWSNFNSQFLVMKLIQSSVIWFQLNLTVIGKMFSYMLFLSEIE